MKIIKDKYTVIGQLLSINDNIIRNKAINAVIKDRENTKCKNLSSAIKNMCVWSTSKEGQYYWADIYYRISCGELI